MADEEASRNDVSVGAIQVMKVMASDPIKSRALVQDATCLGGLVMVLSNRDLYIVNSALETLFKLAEWPEHRNHMKNFIGMMEQLQTLMAQSCPKIRDLAAELFDMLTVQTYNADEMTTPVRDNRSDRDGGIKRRRNTFFLGPGMAKSKMVTLQIRGLTDKDDMNVCRNSLLTITGVISITFDFKKRRVIMRTRPELKPEILARAIARTMTMTAEQVIKDDDGNDVLVPFSFMDKASGDALDNMPDYPDDDSPVRGKANVAKIGDEDGKSDSKWRFVRSVSSFLTNSFYW